MATPRAHRRRATRPLTAALLALAAGLLVAPGSARASTCGRHVAVRLDPSLGGLAVLSDAPAEADRRADLPGLPERPCHGPSCSRRPALPVPAGSIDPARARIDRWATHDALALAADPGGSPLPIEASRPRAVIRPDSIERPPR